MRNYLCLLLLLVSASRLGQAKPLVSVGLGVQAARPYSYPPGQDYNGYYGPSGPYYYADTHYRYPPGYAYAQPYPAPYPSPYSPGQRLGAALDIGIGALSLTPFLL